MNQGLYGFPGATGVAQSGNSFTPLELSGCQLWLDAGYGGGADTWPDRSGNGRAMTLYNGAFFTTNAAGRKVVRFDGSNDYGQTIVNMGLPGNPAFSIVMWLTMLKTGAQGFCGWGNALGTLSVAGLWWSVVSANKFSVEYGGGNSAYTGPTTAVNTRVMVAYTKAAGAINTNSKFYFDGVDAGAFTAASSNTPNITDLPFYLGTWGNYTSSYAQMDVEHALVYNRALTSVEIGQLKQWNP